MLWDILMFMLLQQYCWQLLLVITVKCPDSFIVARYALTYKRNVKQHIAALRSTPLFFITQINNMQLP